MDRSAEHAPGRRAAHRLGRRAAVTGAAAWGAALAGCGSGGGRSGAPTGATGPAATPGASGGPATALPPAVPWRPWPGEVQPAAKQAAVRLVEAFGSWPAGHGGVRDRAARAVGIGVPARQAARLAGQTGSLTPAADEAVVQVVDAQYGGILGDSASVLVVCRQTTRTGATVAHGGTTVDVRLVRRSSGWSVTALHPARPGPARPPGAAARQVLDDRRIALPPAAVADIRSGRVHDSVLRAMLRLAGPYRISVSVVRSGHPMDVFGTNRPSDHPLGRAFDVWEIDGRAVADPATPRALVTGFMRAAAAAGSYNVGGPVQLSGGSAPGRFFSDATHHDHVHIGFTS